jgi:deoxyribodipyrimidine photo-lyase
MPASPKTPSAPALLWFRHDLRLQDNPALAAALDYAKRTGGAIVPIYILDEAGEGDWKNGGASRWWLHHSLASLAASLEKLGSRLILARGDSRDILMKLTNALNVGAVYWNRRYEPSIRARDEGIKKDLLAVGVEAKSFNASLLFEPHTIKNKQGNPFQVFTPFWKHCLAQERLREIVTPVSFRSKPLPAPPVWPASLSLSALDLLPSIPWDAEFGPQWIPGAVGEQGAAKRLDHFLKRALSEYSESRNIPGEDGTSMLSPWLHFGELSPRQVWAAVEAQCRKEGVDPSTGGARTYLAEIGWREFGYHLLYHFPHTPEKPMRAEFARFPWAKDPGNKKLRAWQKGLTGYPIVDAGMRQLWRTGWMHNRVRMIVASFLVKHLRLPWQHGAEWFWDTLVDADLASNTLGWQWSAGCGADAAPYFRIFAPVTQGQRFDADGDYVRTYVPELAKVPAKWIHAPWEAPAEVLAAAGVTLGKTYPRPIVDHAAARTDALQAFALLKELRTEPQTL